MWRCVTFLESFRKGKRIVTKEQTIKLFEKILGNTANLNITSVIENKESINMPELQVALDKQNLFSRIFIPSIASVRCDFEKHLAGISFVEYDDILDPIVATFCFEEKNIFKSSVVNKDYVEKIIKSVLLEEEVQKLKDGDVVEVIEGDYKGIVGRIESIENGIYTINVQIFGCDKALNFTEDQLKIAED